MPTSYTSDIYENKETTFSDFVMQCAKAFVVQMRDTHFKDPIPEKFEASQYHLTQIDECNRRLNELQSQTPADYNTQRFNEEIEACTRRNRRMFELVGRYDSMAAKVKSWQPPTIKHEALKTFMLDQISKSKEFDTYSVDFPVMKDFYTADLRRLASDIEYHATQYRQEVLRIEETNEWVLQLRESLA